MKGWQFFLLILTLCMATGALILALELYKVILQP
jgi:hypothetical protein